MELLGNWVHVESCFGLFGDSVSVSARLGLCLHQTYHSLEKIVLDAHDGTWLCQISFRCIWR
jgi:hypothetical protein